VTVIFAGAIARQPLAGLAWVWLQYLLGFRRLGHEVYFLEESGEIPYAYDYEAMEASEDPAVGARYLDRFLAPFGLDDRWVYRVGDRLLGAAAADFPEICRRADVLVAVSTSLWGWREEYDAIETRICLDVDPGFTQFRAAQGDWALELALGHCNRFVTYGPLLHAAGRRVPTLGREWLPTRPPVVLDEWPVVTDPGAERFTTLMHWGLDPSPEFDGETYGQKDVEFERIIDLPRRTSQPLEVAASGAPRDRLEAHGWHVVSSEAPSRDPASYRRYVQSARGEFSVAKNGYVKTRSGWISDRTVCFLATGKPALVQETGISEWLPTGEGLLTFETLDDAIGGLDEINRHYGGHCAAARALAVEHFASDRVLTELLELVAVAA
jgi:hypothetical protein